jgi:hypothetical protein
MQLGPVDRANLDHRTATSTEGRRPSPVSAKSWAIERNGTMDIVNKHSSPVRYSYCYIILKEPFSGTAVMACHFNTMH